MPVVKRLFGREVLDSRGRPTVEAACELASGTIATASVPSGASTGAGEASELRDGDVRRYRGLGCLQAAANIGGILQRELAGRRFDHQSDLDLALIDVDGTADKSRLGANSILAVSLAFARAVASEEAIPLHRHFADMLAEAPTWLPRPTINLFSGGKHAGGQVMVQDVLVVGTTSTVDSALAMMFEVYQAAASLVGRKYGQRSLVADEGGLAPPFASAEAMLEDAVLAIEEAGLRPGLDAFICVDVASSHFCNDGRYLLGQEDLGPTEMIARLADWVTRFPLVSIEDGLAEEDWLHWPQLQEELGERCLIMGDDLLVTNAHRIRRAVGAKCANALLLKVNQVGTLTEALEALEVARSAGWQVTVSARSGETEDNWLADLAVGWGADQIKVGSITRSERLAKYNRLLAIESEVDRPVNPWPTPGQ